MRTIGSWTTGALPATVCVTMSSTWPKSLRQQVRQVIQAIDEVDLSWEVGLRVVSGHGYFDVSTPKVGDVLARSYAWDDGSPTGIELGGTSAARLMKRRGYADMEAIQSAVEGVKRYGSVNAVAVVLIAGDYRGLGDDPDEILIDGAEVMRVWLLPAQKAVRFRPSR